MNIKSLIKRFINITMWVALIMLICITPAGAQTGYTGDEEALRQLVLQSVSSNSVISELVIQGDLALGAIVELNNEVIIDGSGYIFFAEWDGEIWHVYYEGTAEFRSQLPHIPDTMLSAERKTSLDYENSDIPVATINSITLATGYKLPYPGGVSYYVTRAWTDEISGTACDHADSYAVDIAMPLNRSVVASRSGIVQTVIHDKNICGCVSSNPANMIVIRHVPDDGLYDYYLHIAQYSSLVTVGQTVAQGQPIALSHQIGYTCGSSTCAAGTCPSECTPGANLHFHIQNAAGQRVYTTFDDVGALVGCNTYTSGNYLDQTPPISSISLSGTLGENGWYKSTVQATISATDNLVGVAYSQYNLNGAGWITYTGPFSISNNGSNTLQYQSVDNSGNWETVKSIAFKIDSIAPTNPTTVTSGCTAQNSIWQNTCSDANFTWSGASDVTSGVAGYEYSWDGNTAVWTATPAYNPPAVTDGSHALLVRVKDNAGNWSSWVTLFTLNYDATSPSGSIVLMDGWETTYQTLIRIDTPASDNASGLDSFQVRNSGGDWSGWLPYSITSSWLLPALTGQSYSVEVQYKDRAGNISSTYSDSIYLDIYPDHPASQNYQLRKSTFGMSGTNAQSANFQLTGTLAQVSATGYSESANYQVTSGFWSWISNLIEFFTNFLPLITK